MGLDTRDPFVMDTVDNDDDEKVSLSVELHQRV
jgi:hypothetical protein